MAITQSPLTTGGSFTDLNEHTSASVSPTANRLVLLAVVSSPTVDVPDPPSPTVVGNGLTWDKILDVNFSPETSNFLSNIALFRAMGASPSAGGIVMTWPTTQTGASWAVSEFDGIDTSGTNGSGAIVQSASNTGTTETSLTVTLSAFGSANNATYGTFGSEASGSRTFTPGSGFTEIHDQAGGFKQCVQTEWRADNDTTVDVTISAAARGIAGIAIEIKAASGASDTPINPGVASLTLTGFAPTVTQTAHQEVSPGVASLTLTGFAPTVTQTANQEVSPGTEILTLTGFAPTVEQTGSLELIPGTASLTLTGFAPTVEQTITEEEHLRSGGWGYGVSYKGLKAELEKEEQRKREEQEKELVKEQLKATEKPNRVKVIKPIIKSEEQLLQEMIEQIKQEWKAKIEQDEKDIEIILMLL